MLIYATRELSVTNQGEFFQGVELKAFRVLYKACRKLSYV